MPHAHRWPTWAIALAATIAFAAPIAAQQVPSGDERLWPTSASLLDLAQTDSLWPSTVDESAPAPTVEPVPVMSERQSVALMIVGGAGLIVGSLVDGDTGAIIQAGGGVVGLIGLYNYLR